LGRPNLGVHALLLDLDVDAVEGLSEFCELGQRRLEVLNDLGSDDAGGREVVGVLQALVTQPEDVEVGLVPAIRPSSAKRWNRSVS